MKKYINRELSWLQFNQRVLDEANDRTNLPLDRLFFLTITASNLDEFIMVRVGGLKLIAESNEYQSLDISGMTPKQQLSAISSEYKKMVNNQDKSLENIQEILEENKIRRIYKDQLTQEDRTWLEQYFDKHIFPVITPMQINGKEQTVPILENKSLYLFAAIENDESKQPFLYAAIPIQRVIKRIIELPRKSGYSYIFAEDVISLFLNKIFPGKTILESFPFRLTRNADIELEEEFAENLARAMQSVLDKRLASPCVRIEVPQDASEQHVGMLMQLFEINDEFSIRTSSPIDLTAYLEICFSGNFPYLQEKPWQPQPSPNINLAKPIFKQIAARNIMLFHPYESFDPIVKLIQDAADDPDVLAIKLVLYRTSENSSIIKALVKAAEKGKYVTAVVEIKARFDEANNISWARELEKVGIQVIYGVKGLKTHAKVCLIVRNESTGIVRYVHYGTGNYNEKTAKIYSDIGFLTADKELTEDAAAFFNTVAGLSDPIPYNKIYQSPFSIKQRIIELIKSEAERASQGQEAIIMAKLNSLVDKEVIDALYSASQAGVKIELNIRGICCLRPGVNKLSENIKVVSVIDRFLEHARIIYFHQNGNPLLFISSADWMTRNLEKRIELMIPIESDKEKKRLIKILKTSLNDTVKGRIIKSDGSYKKCKTPPKDNSRSQKIFYKEAVTQNKQKLKHKRTRFQPYKNS